MILLKLFDFSILLLYFCYREFVKYYKNKVKLFK